MPITLTNTRARAKQLAQDGGSLQLLLTDPGDYTEAVLQALRIFERDRPNIRVVDQAIATAGFRFVLFGAGVLSGLAGADVYVPGFTDIREVYAPWVVTTQNQDPLDRNDWRIVKDPGSKWILELTAMSLGVTDVMRLVFTGRHTVTDQATTVDDSDEDPLVMLVASVILELAAVKAVQNTGNTGLPNDIVDRRTQSDMFRSRSKELREMYATAIGYGGTVAEIKPASAVKDMDVPTSHGWGFINRGHRLQ